jgi:hypothetical protein
VALSEDLNLAYQLMKVQQFAPLSSSDAHKLCHLGFGTMNAAFVVAQHFYGGLITHSTNSQTSNVGSSSIANQSSSGSTQNLNSGEADYQFGSLIVAEALWTQQAIVRILQDDTGLLQTVRKLINLFS